MSPEDAKEKRGEDIRRDLDEIVEMLDQGTESSIAWDISVSDNTEEWERLKRQIAEKQKALKTLVDEKKAGRVGADEFDVEYRRLQDELTKLEFAVYNMKLGTNVE